MLSIDELEKTLALTVVNLLPLSNETVFIDEQPNKLSPNVVTFAGNVIFSIPVYPNAYSPIVCKLLFFSNSTVFKSASLKA